MEQRAAFARIYRTVLQDRTQGVLDREARIAGSRQSFSDDGCAVIADQQHVGKRPTDIEAYAKH